MTDKLHGARLRRALLFLLWPAAAAAQAPVSGQVALLERPGERTDDLADALVWLEPAVRGPRAAPATTTMQLAARQFNPRVRAVTRGSRVMFPNTDSFSHNVFSKAPGGAFDTGVYGRGQSREQGFASAGVFPLYCNVHPRMTGYVVVLDTPWFAQAGDDGRWTIAGVPAGSYTLHAWHRRGAAVQQPVTVAAGGTTVGRTEIDARGYRFVQHANKFGQRYASSTGDRY